MAVRRLRMRTHHLRVALLVSGVGLLMVGCAGGQPSDPGEPAPPSPAATVSVSPSSDTLIAGDTLKFAAVVRDANGTVLDQAPVTWQSTDTTVIAVDASGLVSARAAGFASLVASSEGKSGAASLIVRLRFRAMTAGFIHACGLTTAGTIYCWGNNSYRQLGTPRLQNSSTPVPIDAPNLRFTSVVTYYLTTCALADGGTPYCWGLNNSGQFGLGDNSEHPTPVAMPGLVLASIGLGEQHGCGLDPTGVAWCWGDNSFGQLGTPTLGTSQRPAPISPAIRFRSLSVGGFHSCGVSVDGHTYCWGTASYGELGRSNIFTDPPTPVATDPAFASVFAGNAIACGLTPAGVGSCWGGNQFGELGTGDTVARSEPAPMAGGIDWRAIGGYCGLAVSGAAYCWGENQLFEFGTPSNTNSLVPVPGALGATFSTLTTGSQFGCGIGTDAIAYCWGNGSVYGELGSGTATYGMRATRVALQ